MKNLFIGALSGVLIGFGAMMGIGQIPSVNEALFKKDTEESVDTESQEKIENLEGTNAKLEETITNLNTKLTDTENQIKLKDESIATKTAEINQLTIEKNQLLAIKDELENKNIPALNNTIIEMSSEMASLKQELDTYKELIGKDITYVEIINDLTAQLETCESDLLIATAELEQLRVDKETLTARVSELETALTEAQDRLSKYEDLEHIDKYAISSFDGTWYKNSTFEDYFIIKDGIVTHNANEESGVVQNLYNQMYLFMSGSSIAVELSDDGTSFTTADGSVYSIFYTNTEESVVSEPYIFSGLYSNGSETLNLKTDNTLEFVSNNITYYGAYVSSAIIKNVGGNISTIHYITATIQINDEPVIKNLSIIEGSNNLLNVEDDSYFNLISGTMATILTTSSTTIDSVKNTNDTFKITVKTDKVLIIKPGASVSVYLEGAYYSGALRVNGAQISDSFSKTQFTGKELYDGFSVVNTTSDTIKSNLFDFYITGSGQSQIVDFLFINDTRCEVVNVEQIGNGMYFTYSNKTRSVLGDNLMEFINKGSTEFNQIMFNPVNEYVKGSYTSDNLQLDITTDTVVITLPETESISASTYTIDSYTDGYDIYQTVTITYIMTELVEEVETETTHTVVLELKNNTLVGSTLDKIETEFIKGEI